MPCWSACAKCGSDFGAHQYDARPQLAPPSSDLKRSTPPAQTRFESSGSTAMTLSYHPWFTKNVPELQLDWTATTGFDNNTVLSFVESVFLTRASQLPSSPLDVERKTASRPLL